jgi:hypothetical protein
MPGWVPLRPLHQHGNTDAFNKSRALPLPRPTQ